MFNAMRAKLVALAAFAASLVNPLMKESQGPVQTTHSLPGLKTKRYQKSRSRKARARCGHEIEAHMYHDSKLGKRFAEAAYRTCRGF
jgi:hypothetical protein